MHHLMPIAITSKTLTDHFIILSWMPSSIIDTLHNRCFHFLFSIPSLILLLLLSQSFIDHLCNHINNLYYIFIFIEDSLISYLIRISFPFRFIFLRLINLTNYLTKCLCHAYWVIYATYILVYNSYH